MTQVVTLSTFRFDRLSSRLWAFSQMAFARLPLGRTPDIGFWKLCGSGVGEGFTPRPNWSVYAILATWPSLEIAQQRVKEAPVFAKYQRWSAEAYSIFLRPMTSRGKWSGVEPFAAQSDAGDGPLAALTRATLNPVKAPRFWNREPDISNAIGNDPNVAFKIGIGEVPLLHQVTFSVWPNAKSMANFARQGSHAAAIDAVRRENWFKEELYARFRVLGDSGTWAGVPPLERLYR